MYVKTAIVDSRRHELIAGRACRAHRGPDLVARSITSLGGDCNNSVSKGLEQHGNDIAAIIEVLLRVAPVAVPTCVIVRVQYKIHEDQLGYELRD